MSFVDCSACMGNESREYDFSKIRDFVFPNFIAKQREAARAIYQLLHPYFLRGEIRHVIDLGCGTGEILAGIAMMLSKECEARYEIWHSCVDGSVESGKSVDAGFTPTSALRLFRLDSWGTKEDTKGGERRAQSPVKQLSFIGIDADNQQIAEARRIQKGVFEEGSAHCVYLKSLGLAGESLKTAQTRITECYEMCSFYGPDDGNAAFDLYSKYLWAVGLVLTEGEKAAGSIQNNEKPKSPYKFTLDDFRHTCVIMTGMTLPYKGVWKAVETLFGSDECLPKFLYFDICSTWDEALEFLAAGGGVFEEPQRVVANLTGSDAEILGSTNGFKKNSPCVISRFTKTMEDRCQTVVYRGLAARFPSQRDARCFYGIELVNKTTAEIIRHFEEDFRHIKNGETGGSADKRRLDVRRIESISYVGGYTPLNGHLFSIESSPTK